MSTRVGREEQKARTYVKRTEVAGDAVGLLLATDMMHESGAARLLAGHQVGVRLLLAQLILQRSQCTHLRQLHNGMVYIEGDHSFFSLSPSNHHHHVASTSGPPLHEKTMR